MKIRLLFLATLASSLVSVSARAELPQMELVIEPGIADSDDVIKVSVTNSACYAGAEVNSLPLLGSFTIQLSYGALNEGDSYYQCLEENPDAPDFETTVGPLAPGDYGFRVRTHTGGFIFSTADSQSLSVVEAPPAANLSEGGINGLYYNPDADGRYVYVLETDYNTMVMWTTFDEEGNQLWVYGIGETLNDGGTVVANTYINLSTGGVLPNGEVEVNDEHWGVMRVDLSSCLEGTLTYRSDLPEYGSGEFPIRRLAYSEQIGCSDAE